MVLKDISRELDTLEVPKYNPLKVFGLFINVKLRFEDGRTKTYKATLNESYTITIKNRKYFLIPQAVYYQKKEPWIEYYYNNPAPLYFQWRASNLSADKLINREELDRLNYKDKILLTDLVFDSKSLHNAFTSKVFQGFYQGTGTSFKQFFWYALLGLGAVLIVLQLTGIVDVIGLFNSIFGVRNGT